MAEGATSLKGLRAQMAAQAQAQAEERRSLAGTSPGPTNTTNSTTAKPPGPKPVIDGGALRIDERLRVAKERREEADKQQAARESQILERERKAKLQVERQMEERHRKVEEQRKKEEQRRSAVEEKRRQKLEEEKEHYEAVLRRTLERSQRVEQRQKRWSWGGLSTDSDGRAVDKRSTSTMNLKQPSDAGISKRLSSSSATLINSPDKRVKQRSSSCNRLPRNVSDPQLATKEDSKKLQVEQTGPSLKKRSASLTRGGGCRAQPPAKLDKVTSDKQARRPVAHPMDGGFLSRLLTPTQASLARSKSAAALSADGTDAPVSASPMNPARGPLRSRSIDRQKSGAGLTTSVSADGALDPSLKEKRFPSPGGKRPASPSSTLGRHRSPSPAPLPTPKRTPSPSAAKLSPRNRPPSPGGMKQRPPSPQPTSAKPPPIQKPSLTPTGPPTLRKRDSKSKELCPVQPVALQSPDSSQSSSTPSPSPVAAPAPASKTKEKEDPKAAAGNNRAAEAAKMLAENRRLAREQKEKDELLRVQREEEEKLRKEEEERLAEEARLLRLEEEKRLEEERKKQEEEDALKAEEEREKQEAEEAQRQVELQKEREEAEAKALVEAEKARQERDRIMQKNQEERMERKKRIEEIMKRTRKGDQGDYKRDDEEGDEGEDQMNCEAKEDEMAEAGDVTMTTDSAEANGCGPHGEREEPVGSVNGEPEAHHQEHNNGHGSTEEPQAVSPAPTGRLVEGSEFLNEEDPSTVGLVQGLNGKPGPWSFEELIDLNVHSKGRPLIQPEDCQQDLLACDRAPEGPRVAFEDNTLHPSSQPIEGLSEM